MSLAFILSISLSRESLNEIFRGVINFNNDDVSTSTQPGIKTVFFSFLYAWNVHFPFAIWKWISSAFNALSENCDMVYRGFNGFAGDYYIIVGTQAKFFVHFFRVQQVKVFHMFIWVKKTLAPQHSHGNFFITNHFELLSGSHKQCLLEYSPENLIQISNFILIQGNTFEKIQ